MEKQAALIAATPFPNTRLSLGNDFLQLGLCAGDTVVVHTSLSALGWVIGGAVTVIQALQDVLTPEGTLVIPTFSSDISDPSIWENPAVPKEWWDTVRANMPHFDPKITPCYYMGAVPELFRTCPGVLRSNHPANSWAAWGARAADVVQQHSLSHSLGLDTPLGTLYHLPGSKILLLGVSFKSCTAFHLAEELSGVIDVTESGAPGYDTDGKSVWVKFEDLDYGGDDFEEIGQEMEKETNFVTVGRIGIGVGKLVGLKESVNFATVKIIDRNKKK